MPKKQTRENIEAELSANEIDCGVSKLQEAVRGIMEFGARLREMEDDWRIPEFCRSKPIVERMACIS